MRVLMPLAIGAGARLDVLEGEPTIGILRPSTVRRMSKRSLENLDDLERIEAQISAIFNRINRIESLLETKADRRHKVKISVK